MTATSDTGESAVPGVLDDASLRRVVGVLCLGQVTSWGVLYYALPVLSTDIARETGWSAAAVLAAFSAGLVVNAVAGIAVGRAIDRAGPRRVMTAGSVLAVPAVVAVALAPSLPLFVLAWVVVGLAMSATLYAPSFAAVTGWAGEDVGRRVRALTVVTLVGGLASTVFAPLTAALAGPLGWRGTYLVLALVLGVLTVPAHASGLRGRWAPPRSSADGTGAAAVPSRQPVFWAMTAAFTLGVLAVYGGVVNLVPLLVEHGTPVAAASVVLGVGGVGQVAGRLVWAPVAARVPLVARTVGVLMLVAVTTALVAVVPGPLGVLVVLSFLAGTARGVMTLLQATAVSDRWGATDFGRHNGLFTAPVMLASAVSPWAGAALASGLGSFAAAFGVLAALALLAAALVPLTVPRPAGRPVPPEGTSS